MTDSPIDFYALTLAWRRREVDTAGLSDALDSLGVEGILPSIERRSGDRILGRAFTVRYRPIKERHGFRGAADYIDDVPRDSVVVVDNGGREDCTTWGSLLTATARRRGVVGTVIFGCGRDIDDVRASGYPLFTSSVSMRSGKNRVELDAVSVDIVIAGTRVRPGDIIVADSDGVLAIPVELADEVLRRAQAVTRTERGIAEAVERDVGLAEARSEFGYAHPWLSPVPDSEAVDG